MRTAAFILASLLGAAACATAESTAADHADASSGGTVDAGRRADAADQTCGTANCAGCCDAEGTCVDGELDEACGASGAACAACGEGFACEQQACAVPGDSRWRLMVVSGEISATDCDPDGRWDDGTSPPDPYLEVELGAPAPRYTDVASNTLAPDWNNGLAAGTADQLKDSGVAIAAYDDDSSNPDDLIGSCSFPIDYQDFQGAPLELECARDCPNRNSGFTVQAHLEPSP